MARDDSVVTAIRQKDVGTLLSLFFSQNFAQVNPEFRTETELWDYKTACPLSTSPAIEWAELAKDILAFHNTRKGGILIFGVSDKDFQISGDPSSPLIDAKIFNDKVRKYIGDAIWIEYVSQHIKNTSTYFSLAIIPPSVEESGIKRFKKNGPEKNKKCIFVEGGSALRKKDSSITLSPSETNDLELTRPSIAYKEYEIDEPHYRLLSADYHEFILRDQYCSAIVKGLHHNRAATVSLVGIGGVGKTALATWAVKNSYRNGEYDYIVSISAKDRELTSSGIQSISQKLTTLDDLLNSILYVMEFQEYSDKPYDEKLSIVRCLLEGEKVLLFVDNLETTTDPAIRSFLNDLPETTKAIVTSRRNVITFSSYPIEIGPLHTNEINNYITSLANLEKYSYCNALSTPEKENIGKACNGIPLAIRWIISRCSTAEELLLYANTIESAGKSSEELLEFSFRRVFDKMHFIEKSIMQVLAVIDDLPIEAIVKGTGCSQRTGEIVDTLEILSKDTIISQYYDDESHCVKYRLLPLIKKYMLSKCTTPAEEKAINSRLSYWYNASDIDDPGERQIISAMRQGGTNMGDTLISFAENSLTKGDTKTAVRFFEEAIKRDPNNWKTYWRYAEYFRHHVNSIAQAVSYYQTAIKTSSSGKMTYDKAIMHREFGMMYGSTGRADAVQRASENLSIACTNLPHDPISAKFYALMLEKQGKYTDMVRVLQPFENSSNAKCKDLLWPLLLQAYEYQPTKYMYEIAKLKTKL